MWNKKRVDCGRAAFVDVGVALLFSVGAGFILIIFLLAFTFSQKMYSSLVEITNEAIERATMKATANLETQHRGIHFALDTYSSMFVNALETPRVPATGAELASYSLRNASFPQWNGSIYASFEDFGGPATVLWHAERYNQSQLDKLIDVLFWRTGGLGPIMSGLMETWSSTVSQMYSVVGTYTLMYPYYPMFEFYVDLENNPRVMALDPLHNPSRAFLLTPAYLDQHGLWTVTLATPMYSSDDSYIGLAGFDIRLTRFLDCIEHAGGFIPFDAYVVILSTTGTLLFVPPKGASDWAPGLSNFSFDRISGDAKFNETYWNILTNPLYAEVAQSVCDSSYSNKCVATETGHNEVHLCGNKRLISWQALLDYWIVICVADRDKAVAVQRKAKWINLVVSSTLGLVVALAAVSIAAYVIKRMQNRSMSNKINDLHAQLDKERHSHLLVSDNNGEKDTKGLTGNIHNIVETLKGLCGQLDDEDSSIVQEAIALLVHRDFSVVHPRAPLNETQKRFIHDCGIDVQESGKEPPRSASGPPTHRELSHGNKENLAAVFYIARSADINKWDFSVFEYEKETKKTGLCSSSPGLLPCLLFAILKQWKLFKCLDIDKHKLLNFAHALDSAYCYGQEHGAEENPYHNRLHAADVMHSMFYMLNVARRCSQPLDEVITPLDLLACTIAALIHDFKHPGRNNNFLKVTLHKIHTSYGDSVLERHHLNMAFGLLFDESKNCNALAGMPISQQIEFHSLVMELVLATDMAKHVEILDSFRSWFSTQSRPPSSGDPEIPPSPLIPFIDGRGKLLVLQVLIKAADLCNVFRKWQDCKTWTMMLARELLQQGQDEARIGLPVSQFMDGSLPPAEVQITFIPLMVLPLLHSIVALFPDLKDLEKEACANLREWRNVLSGKPGAP